MGWNKVKPITSARIVGGVAPSISVDVHNLSIQSVTRLAVGRYRLTVEGNSTWPQTGGSGVSTGAGTEIQVTPEAASPTAIMAVVEPRSSDNFVDINLYRGNAPYGAAVDGNFYVHFSCPRAAFE